TANDWNEARKLLESAGPHHETALKANPENLTYKQAYRENLSVLSETLLQLGDYFAAVPAAHKLAELALEPITDTYNASCTLSRCVALALKDSSLSESRRKELAQNYASQAMALLRQAVAKGYKDVAHMKKDTDLDPIRGREDFKKLVAELEV